MPDRRCHLDTHGWEERRSWDFGGSAIIRRAPASRMRDSGSIPATSAFMIPENVNDKRFLSQGLIAPSPGVFEFLYSVTGQLSREHKPKHRGAVMLVHLHRHSLGITVGCSGRGDWLASFP